MGAVGVLAGTGAAAERVPDGNDLNPTDGAIHLGHAPPSQPSLHERFLRGFLCRAEIAESDGECPAQPGILVFVELGELVSAHYSSKPTTLRKGSLPGLSRRRRRQNAPTARSLV